MTRRCALGIGVLLLGGLHACGGSGPRPEHQPRPERHQVGNAIVVPSSQLRRSGGTLLDALIGRVSNLRVERRTGTCPLVQLRGQRTILGSQDPRIYVDATPMTDTCILHQLRVNDVERVELYPGGITNRPGYNGNPNGLILVFLTGAPKDD